MVKRVVAYHEPITIARVSLFEGDLEKTIKLFSPKFFKKPDSQARLVYSLLCPGNNPYIMDLAHNPRRLTPPAENYENYNTLLLITSRSDERNQQVLAEFQQRTGMDFARAYPGETELHFKVYDALLEALANKPDKMEEILRQLVAPD